MFTTHKTELVSGDTQIVHTDEGELETVKSLYDACMIEFATPPMLIDQSGSWGSEAYHCIPEIIAAGIEVTFVILTYIRDDLFLVHHMSYKPE